MSDVSDASDVELRTGPAASLFAAGWPVDMARRQVAVLVPDEPVVVVLGSAQAPLAVMKTTQSDHPIADLGDWVVRLGGLTAKDAAPPVVRRRTGGGAVWLDDAMLWLDVWVPASDPEWSADVGRACWWVGQAVAESLGRLGLTGLTVHRGAMIRHERSPGVCWLGVGAGEVLDAAGRKVAGIAQRRVRAGALFQIGILRQSSQWQLAGLFDPPVPADEFTRSEVGCGFTRLDVVAALGERLRR